MSHHTFRKNKPFSFQLMWPDLGYRHNTREFHTAFNTSLRVILRAETKPCYLLGVSVLGFGFGFVYEPGYKR